MPFVIVYNFSSSSSQLVVNLCNPMWGRKGQTFICLCRPPASAHLMYYCRSNLKTYNEMFKGPHFSRGCSPGGSILRYSSPCNLSIPEEHLMLILTVVATS